MTWPATFAAASGWQTNQKNMNIKSEIKVGNNATVGFDKVAVETTCHGFISIRIPLHDAPDMWVELHRRELREFLARTEPAFITTERYAADPIP